MKSDQTACIMSELYHDAIVGLSKKQKQLPSKYFYDERGSDLFERICELDEYYPTDCEMEIMTRNINEITEFLGQKVQLVELGSGSSLKTRLLLEHCMDLLMYVPVDISGSFLESVADKLREEYSDLDIHPVAADYTSPFNVPELKEARKRVIYFPGSTIGNFSKDKAQIFLDLSVASNLTPGDGLLIGVDQKKDVRILEAAYNDSKGVTAAFNKNILARMNRELNSNFDLSQFRHRAFYNLKKGRIEMHLESLRNQKVQINGQQASFRKGETIHTENSYKYTVHEFEKIAGDKFSRIKTWTDKRNFFSVHYFERI